MATFTPTRNTPWLEAPAYRPYAPSRRPSRTLAAARSFVSSRISREVGIIVFAYFAYFLVRGFTEGSHELAVAHANDIVGLEKALGFYWEPWIQDQVVGHHWIVTAANWMYIWGHWPLIAAVAAWLVVKHPKDYTLFRNAFMISGAIGIVVFVTYPVAPPRLADLGLQDTVTMHSHAYRVLQPPAFVNQYAAVPSLHFGWDLLIGIALIRNAKWAPFRILGFIVPVLMGSAIVLTANHYIFDAIAGGAVALTGLALATAWSRRTSARVDNPTQLESLPMAA